MHVLQQHTSAEVLPTKAMSNLVVAWCIQLMQVTLLRLESGASLATYSISIQEASFSSTWMSIAWTHPAIVACLGCGALLPGPAWTPIYLAELHPGAYPASALWVTTTSCRWSFAPWLTSHRPQSRFHDKT